MIKDWLVYAFVLVYGIIQVSLLNILINSILGIVVFALVIIIPIIIIGRYKNLTTKEKIINYLVIFGFLVLVLHLYTGMSINNFNLVHNQSYFYSIVLTPGLIITAIIIMSIIAVKKSKKEIPGTSYNITILFSSLLSVGVLFLFLLGALSHHSV